MYTPRLNGAADGSLRVLVIAAQTGAEFFDRNRIDGHDARRYVWLARPCLLYTAQSRSCASFRIALAVAQNHGAVE